MSLETWKAEFYPEEAHDASERGDSAAVKHSMRKWVGLSPANLEKHGMVTSEIDSHIFEQKDHEKVFRTHAGTCALCELYVRNKCKDCPLTKARGVSCDDERDDEEVSPWYEWAHMQNPFPMTYWLNLAKEHCND